MRQFIFFTCLSLLLAVHLPGSHAAAADPSRECVVTIAESQIGVREVGRNNFGPEIKLYLQSVGLPQGHPYCGAFLVWVFKKCGQDFPRAGAQARAWHVASRLVYSRDGTATSNPQPGDIATFYYQALRRIGHVELVERWQARGMVTTIGANTGPDGGRDGNGVWRKRRLRAQIHSVSDWIS